MTNNNTISRQYNHYNSGSRLIYMYSTIITVMIIPIVLCTVHVHVNLAHIHVFTRHLPFLPPLQYLGTEITEPVKDRVKELLYSWKVGLPNEPKITEAYEMLKRQGLVTLDFSVDLGF